MDFTLKGMAGALFRHKTSLLLFTLHLALAFALYLCFTKRTYESSAEILVRFGREQSAGPAASSSETSLYAPRRAQEIQNEIRILTSADTLMSAARVMAGPDAGEADRLRLREYLQKNLAVSVVKDTDIVTASFFFPDPAVARDVLTLIIEQFQLHRTAVYFSPGELETLRNNMAAAHADYTAAFDELAGFEAESRLYDGARIPELASNLEGRRAQLNSLRNDFVYSKVKLERLRATLGTLPKNVLFIVRESHNGLRDDFKGRLSDLALEKERLLARFQEDYSSVADVQKEIDNLTELIDAEPERLVNEKETRPNDSYAAVHNAVLSLSPEVDAMAERIHHLEAQIRAEEEALARANGNRSSHAVLSREVELKKSIYDRSHRDYSAAISRHDAQVRGVTSAGVIARPSFNPVPARPDLPRFAAVAAAALLLGNLFILGVRVFAGNTIFTPEEAARVLGRPVVGVFGGLSRAGLDGGPEGADIAPAAFERQKKNFRHLYLRVAADVRPAALLFTSNMGGADSLSLAYNFAAFAREYQQRCVAVVNYSADVRRRAEEPAAGPAVADRTFRGVDEFVRSDDIDIVAGRRFLEELKGRYDLVIVNYEPLQESPVLIALAGELDRVVYRVGAERTNRLQASRAIETLAVFGFGDIGLAVTERRIHIPACLGRFL